MIRPAAFSALALVFILAQPSLPSDDAGFRVSHTQNAEALTPFDVFEITFEHPNHSADPDDDGDGFPDKDEVRAGTNPLDSLSFPVR